MSAAKPLRLLVGAYFAICVVAGDDGDDFSNNLFTDLTPLLTLFGERVTTQFMSQSTGWADNIILAMAPLGIMTVIISAIRVGGPSWLKAIIGRARENRAVAESELMSSTSHEVCELWNGQQIVRVMGEGPIREFIILSPEENGCDGVQANGSESVQAQTGTSEKGGGSRLAKGGAERGSQTPKANEKTLVMDLRKAKKQRRVTDCNPTVREHLFGSLSQQPPDPPKPKPLAPEEKTFGDAHQPVQASQPGRSLRERILGMRVPQGRDTENATPDLNKRRLSSDPDVETLSTGHRSAAGDSNIENRSVGLPSAISDSNVENQGTSRPSVIVIRNRDVHSPNLTLNIHNKISKGDIYAAAVAGLFFQLGVLVYFGIAAKYFTHTLLKDGNPVADYAFPCTFVGTVFVVVGTLICAHVVETSTSEKRYRPADGMNARVVWLQRSGTVSDQAFESYAVFPEDPKELVMTSQRAPRRRIKDLWRIHILRQLEKPTTTEETTSKQQSTWKGALEHALEAEIDEFMAVAGTILGICGFVVQFVGLRGMHWSASLAQLGAIAVMTILRAAVRRNLARIPQSRPLIPGHELDWLAMTLGDPTNAPWRDPPANNRKRDKYDRPWRNGSAWDWKVAAVEIVEDPMEAPKQQSKSAGPEAEHYEDSNTARRKTDGSTESKPPSGLAGAGTRGSTKSLQRGKTCESQRTQNSSIRGRNFPHARSVMELRRDLGELSDWPGPASMEAISLARAIEVTMDGLFDKPPAGMGGVFTWSLQAIHSDSDCEPIPFHVKHSNGKWKAYSDEIEAALSLWLYSVHEQEMSNQRAAAAEREGPLGNKETKGDNGGILGPNSEKRPKDDAWLRAKGTPAKPSLRLLGPYTATLLRDFQWWMPDGASKVIEADSFKLSHADTIMEVEPHRIVGFASRFIVEPHSCLYERKPEKPREGISLAVKSYCPLKTLYAQQMFSVFMRAAAKSMKPISSKANIQPTKTDDSEGWQSFTLRDGVLSQMVQDIQNTGLGSSSDVFLSILPVLSIEKKLPRLDAVVKWTQEHAELYERRGHSKTASEAYCWLFGKATTFPRQNEFAMKATALLTDYSRAITDEAKIRKAQRLKLYAGDLEYRMEQVERALLNAGVGDIMSALGQLYNAQGRPWENRLVNNTKAPIKYYDLVQKFTSLEPIFFGEQIDPSAGDILGWTSLHYAAAHSYDWDLEKLLGRQADTNVGDMRGRTPLHYACQNSNTWVLHQLLQRGADINVRDMDGKSPLHHAVIHGHDTMAQALVEAGADTRVVDGLGRTLLHEAAYGGREGLVKLMKDVGINMRDHSGRTVLHLAALAKGGVDAAAIGYLLVTAKADLEAKDNQGFTPLHLAAWNNPTTGRTAPDNTSNRPAAQNGREGVLRSLLEAGADKEAKDEDWRTPLHLAAENHDETATKLLIDAGANMEAKLKRGQAPLHIAASRGNWKAIEILIGAGADKEARDGTKDTPLHVAATHSREAIKVLVSAGADIEARDRGLYTPLFRAVIADQEESIKYLIESGADIEAKIRPGATPLHFAAKSPGGKGVKPLLDAGASTEVRDDGLNTPLHWATSAWYAREDTVRLLLEAGASKEAMNRRGKTPHGNASKNFAFTTWEAITKLLR